MLTGKLWPAHPAPFRDELLSSWLVRLAHSNGCKVQTFCHLIFNDNQEVWNRDIDRLAPAWLLNTLSRQTCVPPRMIQKTTLRKFDGVLYPYYRSSGHLNWVIPLQMHHRKRKGHGLQYCPQCLAEDDEPYYRTTWRLALQTFCPVHHNMMLECCPHCSAPIAFHRQELGKPNEFKPKPLNICSSCELNLSDIAPKAVHAINDISFRHWESCLRNYSNKYSPLSSKFEFRHFAVLRHICGLICNSKLAPDLQAYICDRTGLSLIEFSQKKMIFEQRSIPERHQAILLAWWLLENWPERIYKAWYYHAIRYNLLLKDLDDYPDNYGEFVKTLNRNHNKELYVTHR